MGQALKGGGEIVAGQEKWRDWIEVENPPILAETAAAADAFNKRTTQTAQILAAAIEADLGLSYSVLRRANRGLKRLGNKPVLDLAHALSLAGIGSVLSICETSEKLAVGVADERAGLLRYINSVAAHSREVLSFLKPSAGGHERALVSIQFLPAYLVAQNAAKPPAMLRDVLLVEDLSTPAVQKRHATVGFDRLADEIVKCGLLPSILAELCAPDQMLRPDHVYELLAARLALAAGRDWRGAALEEYIDCAATLMDQPPEKVWQSFRAHVLRTAQSMTHTVPFPAAMSLAAAVPLPLAPHIPRVEGTTAPKPKAGPAPVSHPRPVDSRPASRLPARPSIQASAAAAPPAAGDRPDSAVELKKIVICLRKYEQGEIKVHQMFSGVVDGLRLGLQLDRVALGVVTKKPRGLAFRIVSPNKEAEALKGFKLDLEQASLFARLMRKPQNVWLNQRTRGKLLSLIPATLSSVIDPKGFFASSLFVRGKPVAMIYADKKNGEGELEEAAYRRFRLVCEKTAKSMEAVSA